MSDLQYFTSICGISLCTGELRSLSSDCEEALQYELSATPKMDKLGQWKTFCHSLPKRRSMKWKEHAYKHEYPAYPKHTTSNLKWTHRSTQFNFIEEIPVFSATQATVASTPAEISSSLLQPVVWAARKAQIAFTLRGWNTLYTNLPRHHCNTYNKPFFHLTVWHVIAAKAQHQLMALIMATFLLGVPSRSAFTASDYSLSGTLGPFNYLCHQEEY